MNNIEIHVYRGDLIQDSEEIRYKKLGIIHPVVAESERTTAARILSMTREGERKPEAIKLSIRHGSTLKRDFIVSGTCLDADVQVIAIGEELKTTYANMYTALVQMDKA